MLNMIDTCVVARLRPSFVPLVFIVRIIPTTVGAYHGATHLASYITSGFFPVTMMTICGEILFGSLSFIVDESTWLPEAPLDTDVLRAYSATHFRATSFVVLLRQPSVSYHSTPLHSVVHRHKLSGCSMFQWWIKHTGAL